MNNDNRTSPPDEAALRRAFTKVYDPEFGVSIEDLGLIYEIDVSPDGVVSVTMTLTSMYCPAGDVITAGVKSAAEALPGVSSAEVRVVFEPPWTPDMLSAEGRRALGWDEPQVEE